MADVDEQVPPGVDTSKPSIARVYDYYLGGKDNFACDREFAERLRASVPEAPIMANQNRAFLGRVVRFLAEQGVNQFIDIGTGLPTQQNVHDVARSLAPDARVAYVDNDPIVLAHARALLAENPNTIAIEGDLRAPATILTNADLCKLIDFDRPVAILLIGILYFMVEQDRPSDIVEQFKAAMAPGSYLAISHVVSDDDPEGISEGAGVLPLLPQPRGRRPPHQGPGAHVLRRSGSRRPRPGVRPRLAGHRHDGPEPADLDGRRSRPPAVRPGAAATRPAGSTRSARSAVT